MPSVYLFGRSADAALSVNILFWLILLLSTYGIGRLAKNGKAGLLAAFLVATYPPIVGLSRIYRPHAALPACAALSLLLLLLLLKTRSVKIAWLLGASLGFGILIHVYFVLVLTAPTVLTGLYLLLFQTNPRRPPSLKATPGWLLRKLRDPFVLYGMLPAVVIAAGLAATWYVPQAGVLFSYLESTQALRLTETRGFPSVPHSFWWYALTARRALSRFFVILLGIGLLLPLLRPKLVPSVLVIVFLVVYTSFGLGQFPQGLFIFASVLPIFAALTAIWVVDIRDSAFVPWARAPSARFAPATRIARWLSIGLTGTCVAVAAFNFSVLTWGVRPWSRSMALALGAPLDSATCDAPMNVAFCPNPARDEDWRASDILRVILDDPACQTQQCHLVVVPRLSTFEVTVLKHHLMRDFPESFKMLEVSRPGWKLGEESYEAQWLASDYLAYIPQMATGSKIRFALTRFLQSPPAAFADTHQEVASFLLPGHLTAKLIRRTQPLTLDEARQAIAVLEIPEEGKSAMLREIQEQIQDGAVDISQAAGDIEPGDKMDEPTPRGVGWSLASNLSTVQAYSDETELLWWVGGTWAKPYPYAQDVLVGPSTLSVEGIVRADQVHLHPFSADQNTYVGFDVKDCPYDALEIGYGLADEVAGLSNGVRYTLWASLDGGDSYEALWDGAVMDSVWRSETLPLAAYRGKDVTFQLAVNAMGEEDYDWLQTTVLMLSSLE